MNRPRMRRTGLIGVGLGFALAGCSTAEVPAGTGSDPDAGEIFGPEVVELEVDAPPAVTSWQSLPITGIGPGGGTLFYRVTGADTRTLDLGPSGAFCVDVALEPGGNQVVLSAEAPSGAASDERVLTIRREGQAPDDGGPTSEILDRTPGALYFGNADGSTVGGVSLEAGTFADLVDGDDTDLVRFQGAYLNNEAIAYALSESMAVHRFEVVAPPSGGPECGPGGFEVWLSNLESPPLTFDGISWVKVAEMDDGASGGATYSLDSAVAGLPARYVALRMNDASCGYLDNVYGLRELRVFAETASAEPPEVPTGGPSCASGGP